MSQLIVVPMDKKTKTYATVDTFCMGDDSLSWREKGILQYLLSRPPKWKVNMTDLQRRSRDGRDAVYNAINILRREKYIHRTPYYEHGKIVHWIFVVFPRPTQITKKQLEELLPELQEEGHLLPENLEVGSQEGLVYKKDRTVGGSSKKKTTRTKKIPDPKKKTGIQERTMGFLIYAKKLATIIKSTKNVKTSNQRLTAWSDSFRKLHETDGVEKCRIKAAMIWYRENVGGQYVPVVESGDSFRTKFIKIENAMERSGELKTPEEIATVGKKKFKVGHK